VQPNLQEQGASPGQRETRGAHDRDEIAGGHDAGHVEHCHQVELQQGRGDDLARALDDQGFSQHIEIVLLTSD